MDPRFCCRYRGDGMPPSNRYCRSCPDAAIACDRLWRRVVDLAGSHGGAPVPLPGTRAVLSLHPKNEDFVRLQVNVRWNLTKEDFLHFIATGHAKMGRKEQRCDPAVSPSLTRQEPYVQAIVALLGGPDCPEIALVRAVQQG
ncbi:hypothetical protein FGU65_06180 [Methanoculleus sp. FWC-SCC1]|uniref:Uncharacterized protein n=1 Tax=Methanoculleus frigidifontis TaxID=2584085 RepID=A0ABT8M987_9EURY|nr:hypothetical protein [Methanoculleus sp. FWC-SCC1]MDN7024479.1 hypothetical protein [Methanoculleus sp. FWC-SCC1]